MYLSLMVLFMEAACFQQLGYLLILRLACRMGLFLLPQMVSVGLKVILARKTVILTVLPMATASSWHLVPSIIMSQALRIALSLLPQTESIGPKAILPRMLISM